MPFPDFIRPQPPVNHPMQRCPVSRKSASKRILIVKFGALGDILMATPILAALREAYPSAYLTWVAEHGNVQAVDANPYIDEVIAWDGGFWHNMLAQRWKNMATRERGLGMVWLSNALRLAHKLGRRRYDLFISYHPEQWPLLLYAVRPKLSVGVFETNPRPGERRRDYQPFYDVSFSPPRLPLHRTDKYLLPLSALDLDLPTDKQMVMGYTAEDAARVDQFLQQCGVYGRFVVLAPKTTWETRNWPEERYVELGDRLSMQMLCRCVVIGSPRESAAVERIASRMRTNPVRASGIFSFRQMAALIDRAALAIGSDSGPMHVAAAVGTPYIALFGPTPVDERVPLSGKNIAMMQPVPCGPCDREVCLHTDTNRVLCMHRVSVDEVIEAAIRVLSSQTC